MFENISAILKQANVVKTTVYLKNRSDFEGYARVRSRYFKTPSVNTGIYRVQLFDPKALIEVEAVAVA